MGYRTVYGWRRHPVKKPTFISLLAKRAIFILFVRIAQPDPCQINMGGWQHLQLQLQTMHCSGRMFKRRDQIAGSHKFAHPTRVLDESVDRALLTSNGDMLQQDGYDFFFKKLSR